MNEIHPKNSSESKIKHFNCGDKENLMIGDKFQYHNSSEKLKEEKEFKSLNSRESFNCFTKNKTKKTVNQIIQNHEENQDLNENKETNEINKSFDSLNFNLNEDDVEENLN